MIHYQKLRNRDKYIVIFSVVLLVSIFALSNSFIAHSLTQQNTAITSVKGFTIYTINGTSILYNATPSNHLTALKGYKYYLATGGDDVGNGNFSFEVLNSQDNIIDANPSIIYFYSNSFGNAYFLAINSTTYANQYQKAYQINTTASTYPYITAIGYNLSMENASAIAVYNSNWINFTASKGKAIIVYGFKGLTIPNNLECNSTSYHNPSVAEASTYFYFCESKINGLISLNTNFQYQWVLVQKPQTITYSGLFSYDSIGEPFSCSLTGSYTGTPYINGVPYPYTETFKTYQLNPSKLYYTIYDGIGKTNYTEALPMYNSTAIFGFNETFPFWFSIIQNGTYSNNGDSLSGSLMTFKKLDYTSTFYPYLDSVLYNNNNVLNVSHLNRLTDFLFGQNLYTQIPSNISAVIPINITIPSTNSTQYFNLSVRLQNTISLNNIILPANKSALSNININEEFGNYTSSPTYFKLVKVSNDGSISNYDNNYNEISTITNYTFEFEIDSNGIATGTNITGIKYFTTIKNETASFQIGNSTYTINTFSVPSNPFNITFVSNLPVIPSVFGKINLTSFKALFYKSSTGYISNESPFYYTYYTKGSIPYLFNLQLNGQNYNQLGTFTYDNHNYSFGTTIDLPSTTNLTIPFYAVINGITYSNKSYLETTYFNPCLVSQPTNTQTFYGSFNNGSLSVVIKNGTNGTTGHSTSLPPPPSTPPTIIGSIGNIFKGTSTLLGFAYLNLGQFSFFFTLQFLYIVGLFIIMFFLYRKMGSHRTFTQVLLIFMGTFIIIGILTKILNGIFAVIMALLMAVELVYAFRSIL